MTTSLLESLIELPDDEREAVLRETSDEEAALLLFDWHFWARENQLPPPGDWRVWLLLSGRGFGKTRVGAEWVREQVREYPRVNLIGPTAADVRDVMVKGESGIMAVCPVWEQPVYHPSTRSLSWPNGAQTLTFSAEDPESLRGPQCMRLWGDEIAAWQYPQETWDLAMLGLRLGPDPRALATTTPKPIPLLRMLVEQEGVEITKGTTYDNLENLGPPFHDLIRRFEGTRFGRQELEAELLLDEGLAYRVSDGVHIVTLPALDPSWMRFESMDYGTNNPCWLAYAVDYDGNVLAFGLEDTPGLLSEQAERIHERRLSWWAQKEDGQYEQAVCFAPPDIRTRWGKRDVTGKEMSAESEFNENGIYFAPAQNDRRAGYVRVAEMLKLDAERMFPAWHPMAGQPGAPRLYIADTEEMAVLVKALRDAPLEDPDSPLSRFPGEAVDQGWESSVGHAHAALRYGLMSRPGPSAEPEQIPDDPRAALMQKVEAERDGKDKTAARSKRYQR